MSKSRPRAAKVVVPRYHRKPSYGPVGKTGGTYMQVVLGPTAAFPENRGSSTNASSIPGLMRPLHAEDPGKWVAGHLLNDNLGGSGTQAYNLTPLTQTANKQHAKYEDRIKRMCDRADLYHRNHPDSKFWYGVRYTVQVSKQTFGDFSPYDGAPSHITITSEVVRVDKVTGGIYPLPAIDRFNSNPANFGPVEIHNDDSHLF